MATFSFALLTAKFPISLFVAAFFLPLLLVGVRASLIDWYRLLACSYCLLAGAYVEGDGVRRSLNDKLGCLGGLGV